MLDLRPAVAHLSLPWHVLSAASAQAVTVGIVGGSDLHKIAEQLGEGCEFDAAAACAKSQDPDEILTLRFTCPCMLHLPCTGINAYDYVFAENGLDAYKAGQLLGKQSFKAHLGGQLSSCRVAA